MTNDSSDFCHGCRSAFAQGRRSFGGDTDYDTASFIKVMVSSQARLHLPCAFLKHGYSTSGRLTKATGPLACAETRTIRSRGAPESGTIPLGSMSDMPMSPKRFRRSKPARRQISKRLSTVFVTVTKGSSWLLACASRHQQSRALGFTLRRLSARSEGFRPTRSMLRRPQNASQEKRGVANHEVVSEKVTSLLQRTFGTHQDSGSKREEIARPSLSSRQRQQRRRKRAALLRRDWRFSRRT